MTRFSSSLVETLLLTVSVDDDPGIALRSEKPAAPTAGVREADERAARFLTGGVGCELLATHSRPRATHFEQGMPPSHCNN